MCAIRRKELPTKPDLETFDKRLLWDMCELCWNCDPKKRIKVKEIITYLEDAADDDNDDDSDDDASSYCSC